MKLSWLVNKKTPEPANIFVVSFHEDGARWTTDSSIDGIKCSPNAASILDYLCEEELVQLKNETYQSSWNSLFSIIGFQEFDVERKSLGIPETINYAPAIASNGTLQDQDFGIYVNGWISDTGQTVRIKSQIGPILIVDNDTRILTKDAWVLLTQIQKFWKRDVALRDPESNRIGWGNIRQNAIAIGAGMNDFLSRSVVLTPDKLKFETSRVKVGESQVIEIIPLFIDAPSDWLSYFDRFSNVQSRYDIPTENGIVQVVLQERVKNVLNEVKKMPGRRVSGKRAEAFLSNPYSLLGEDAANVIDEESFAKDGADQAIEFDRFIAAIRRSEKGKLVYVGLQIISDSDSTNELTDNNQIEFTDTRALEEFVIGIQLKIDQNYQLFTWNGYEFEIMGETAYEVKLLNDALTELKTNNVLLDYDEVYDLSKYGERILGIELQDVGIRPAVSIKNKKRGWFPDNIDTAITWVAADGSHEMILPFNESVESEIKQQLQTAKNANSNTITLPFSHTPISVSDVESILQIFKSLSADVSDELFEDLIEDELLPTKQRTILKEKENFDDVLYLEDTLERLRLTSFVPHIPHSLKTDIQLKAYQLSGIAWLQHMYQNSPLGCRGVILADDMGLGKTLQLLTLIAWIFEQDPDSLPVLIVAPVSLLENWEQEVSKFFKPNTMPVLTAYGKTLDRLKLKRHEVDAQLLNNGLVKFLRPNWVGDSRLILTTYETMRDLEFSFSSIKWSVMICDEAQKIKNPIAMVTKSAKKQNVRFKVACTGTPVENSLVDLWCLFDFVQPGHLGALSEFKRLYISDDDPSINESLDGLRQQISAHILRRTKLEVAKDLPAKLIDAECQTLPISTFQRSLYSQALNSVKGIKNDEKEVRSGFKTYLELLHFLRKICTHPMPLNEFTDQIESIASYRVKAPKIEWLIKQLNDIKFKNEKVIVFCEFRSIQVLLRHYIHAELGFKPEVINGDTSTNSASDESRQKKITAFQNLPGFAVIILSPIAVGFGVNIQSANHVIHYMRTWNPAKEDQATDRAYRIGQTKDVHVYYPTVTATDFVTFDQRLNELLTEKRAVADDILSATGELKAADFIINDIEFKI